MAPLWAVNLEKDDPKTYVTKLVECEEGEIENAVKHLIDDGFEIINYEDRQLENFWRSLFGQH